LRLSYPSTSSRFRTLDEAAALRLLQQLGDAFQRDRFVTLASNLLYPLDRERSPTPSRSIPTIFQPYLSGYDRVGRYTDIDHNTIDVLIVRLTRDSALDGARTMQRNFVARYLSGSGGQGRDAALVAFVPPDDADWRLSLVKMEYGHLGRTIEFTPARRFSFLVGRHESIHTALQQLVPCLTQAAPVTLSTLVTAFSVERVSNEFFERYRELVLAVSRSQADIAKTDEAVAADFAAKGISAIDFAKKLLGQIVFLYFLQKKGWLGVERDRPWGSGPRDFLRALFRGEFTAYDNFFNDVLEPLFYEALAVERTDHYYGQLRSKVPFLNGGLFEPLRDYDWLHTDLRLPNSLFSNDEHTASGDEGTGIFDVFDRYNFTVREDEPLEKDVAVDPEMLGKVFENLLEVGVRHATGSYYTPREVVHYMCQESITNYLANRLPQIPRSDVVAFLQHTDLAMQRSAVIEIEAHSFATPEYVFPQSIRDNASLVDRQLATIRVCDPAIGSGAFPVGMMSEIVRAREALSALAQLGPGRTAYAFKRHAIADCLYGVDIDPGAVEIAKLRLWLSLVVDESDMRQIQPLPNLDYKIMQGNSLLEEYQGIAVFDDSLIAAPSVDRESQIAELKDQQFTLQREYIALHSADSLTPWKKQALDRSLKQVAHQLKRATTSQDEEPGAPDLFEVMSKLRQKSQELRALHREFMEASHKNAKDRLRSRIDVLEWELIEASLHETGGGDSLPALLELRTAKRKPFFPWRLQFAEVFEEKGGFDVIIANPPYVSAWSMETDDPALRPLLVRRFAKYRVLTGHWDLYMAFVLLGVELTRPRGVIAFILPNPVLHEKYAAKLRAYLLSDLRLDSLLVFDESNVFAGVSRKTAVVVIERSHEGDEAIDIYRNTAWGTGESLIQHETTIDRSLWQRNPTFQFKIRSESRGEDLLDKIDAVCVRVGNVAYVNYGAQVSSRQRGAFRKQDVVGHSAKGNPKKFFEGKDLHRWQLSWRGLWLDYRKAELYGPRDEVLFESDKIALRHLSDRNHRLAGTLDTSQMYCDHGVVLVVPYALDSGGRLRRDFEGYERIDDAISIGYLAAHTFSALSNFYYRMRFATESLQQATSHVYPQAVRGLPLKLIGPTQQRPFEKAVGSILELAELGAPVGSTAAGHLQALESELDHLVFDLYGLSHDEIAFIEGALTEV
jgi:hypothetical protein